MERVKHDTITVKKTHIIYPLITAAIFLVGFFIGGIGLFEQTGTKNVENCRKFCEFIPDTEFSHVSQDNHCFCLQKNQKLYDSLLNKTLIYTRIVDAGIINDVQTGTK